MLQEPDGQHGPDGRHARERAVLVGVDLDSDGCGRGDVDELEALAKAAGAVVVGAVWQRRECPDAAMYIGRGKVAALGRLAREQGANLVISNNDLSAAQARNLEEATGIRVVDRSQLIMDIFAAQANSRQAKFQVELAQLQYTLPRLKRLWTHLDRYKGGIGMRGPGERQIESDRRIIQRRIGQLKRYLEALDQRKQRELEGRQGFFSIGVVGYTNAGKSTLLNRLTASRVETADRPFSTLDTRTRVWHLGGGLRALLSDTVGFIRDLPHHLIASFRATLAEAATADLLLHVVDGSHDRAQDHVQVVDGVLEAIGAGDVPRILLINKIDRVESLIDIRSLERSARVTLAISARNGQGLSQLEAEVCRRIRGSFRRMLLCVSMEHAGILARLRAAGCDVGKPCKNGDLFEVEVRLPPWGAGLLAAAAERGEVAIRLLSPTGGDGESGGSE
ncbi:MAG: GTPase HflX [Planctomycetota bacterium]